MFWVEAILETRFEVGGWVTGVLVIGDNNELIVGFPS